jgi:hypothetical protein
MSQLGIPLPGYEAVYVRRITMRRSSWMIKRQITGCLAAILAAPIARAVSSPNQELSVVQDLQSSPSTANQEGASSTETGKQAADGAVPAPRTAGAQPAESGRSSESSAQSSSQQPAATEKNNSPAKAVGAAAAPLEKIIGSAGSRVSGAVIAPAKQRRVRIMLIRVGVVVGACVAIGTVVVLSHATPSQPR